MIRMFQSSTSAQAKDYFKDALSKADYYLEDQEVNGQFNGRIAKRLGLEGKTVDKETFEKLCDNINPKEGGSLTPRTVDNRRVGYDISFHCPKSVSILHALGEEKRVLPAFEQSVHETMLEMQEDMQVRVRTDGQNTDRETKELLWANFVHQTARPVEGKPPDPHLHAHCFTFNVTYDEVEGKYKAGQFHNIKRDMPYYQARFQKRLADKLSDVGYGIRKTKNGFELAVIPQKAIDHFSKRTNLIGQVAKEKGITDQKKLDQLGAKTRAKKQKNLTMPQLQDKWRDQLHENGIDDKTPEEIKTTNKSHSATQSIDHAINHVFTRNSVKRDRQILAEGYKYAIDNKEISLDEIDTALEKNDTVFKIEVGSQRLCTTKLVHAEERRMIELARDGVGKLRPLKANFKPSIFSKLNDEQRLVMNHVMTSQDRVTMIRGAAGTGKTTLLKEIVPQIEKTGKNVFLFAPTAEASRDVLRREGFVQADTVARLLMDKELQQQIKGQVIWIDEAGMLGSQDMANILSLAKESQARVILSGDPRQHTAVMRGDAMRLLQEVGKIRQVSMETIYRQKEAGYKQAVKAISNGNIKSGFETLQNRGSIKQCEPTRIKERLVGDYLTARKSKKSALVITPTNEQAKEINITIREGLRESKLIGKREKRFTVFDNYYLSVAQKEDIRSYREGQVIQTHQNFPRIKKGAVLHVDSIVGNLVTIKDNQGQKHILPIHRAKDYDVYSSRKIPLSKGDEIRINKNGFDKNKKRINNSTILTVNGFTKNGDIKAVKHSAKRKSDFVLDKSHSNYDYAYAITSYSSQGKTVDNVIISQPASTFPASNEKQFYVSVSRGRENVSIYTDDAEELLTHIKKRGDRQGATELIKPKFAKTIETTKEINKVVEPVKTIDIEPEL
ncbi:MobF family relaxase [Flavivirga abyssicola]|uniref:MobF family relaxase n=1 Tax=Flavivirga abyssicola TaxID=3063533 RepID=UPI0026E097D4|nr:MobF family relaxase [Flavivirga sp. MEBiC07777]WVK15090.1 MobF family relaxase [Flavivirga sp. MEBiC07777]